MKKTILFTILSLFLLVTLSSSVLAYTVDINWEMGQTGFDVEVYNCKDSVCSDVNSLVISDNSGSSDSYRTVYSTSGTQYHAVYLYKEGYRVKNYIIKSTGGATETVESTFEKRYFCFSNANYLNYSPTSPDEGDTLDVEFEVQSAFTAPDEDDNMPLYAPTTHAEFFTSDVEVGLTLKNNTDTFFFDSKNVGIFESTNKTVKFTISNLPSGEYSLIATTQVTDNQCDGINDIGGITSTINVNDLPDPNNPPVITTLPITQAEINKEYIYDVNATDPDLDTLTYSLNSNPPGMTINPTTGLISWTPISQGNYSIELEVSDNQDSTTQSFTISVTDTPNNPPVITTLPITSINLGDVYFYDVNATDQDTLFYSLETAPVGMAIDNSNGIITWIPSSTGNYNVVINVTDTIDSTTQSFTISVTDTLNNPPVITTLPITQAEINKEYIYDVNATDQDGDTLIYNLINGFPQNMTINPTTGLISWTPSESDEGNITITISVTDTIDSTTQSFTLFINDGEEENNPPVVEIGSPVSGETYYDDELISFDANVTDPEGEQVTLIWFSSIDGFLGTGIFDRELSAGTHIITATATDSQGAETTISITINVLESEDEVDSDGSSFAGRFSNAEGLFDLGGIITSDDTSIKLGRKSPSQSLIEKIGAYNTLLLILIIILLVIIFLAILLR